MEPNDQYLCIVPDSRTRSANEPVYLPFEGDATLSIILSKALLLADDTKIKDPVISPSDQLREVACRSSYCVNETRIVTGRPTNIITPSLCTTAYC